MRFAAAWCSLATHDAHAAIRWLVRLGVIEQVEKIEQPGQPNPTFAYLPGETEEPDPEVLAAEAEYEWVTATLGEGVS